MARPQLSKERKRLQKVIFRLTEAEQQRLVQLAETCRVPLGRLIREKLLNRQFPVARTPKLDLLTYAELKKICVNINQLAWNVNSGFCLGYT